MTTARTFAGAIAAIVLGGVLAAACSSSSTTGGSRTQSAATGGAASTTAPPTTTTVPPRKTTTTKPHTHGSGPGATVGVTTAPPPPLPGQVTFVGDSVGVDTTPYLEQDIPGIRCNAMVDRSWGEGESVLQSIAAEGELGTVVVVELGLNGPIDDADFQSMMSILAHVPRVVFVNVRLPVGAYGPGTDWWGSQNNAVLASEVPHYHNALLANWYAYSAGHSSWFAPDGIHLDGLGGAAMAELIKAYV
jgi:hypothetical protein